MGTEDLDRDRPLFDARLPVELRRPDLLERKEVRATNLTVRVHVLGVGRLLRGS